MIDPARIVAIDSAIYHPTVIQTKEKSVARIVGIGAGAFYRLLGGNALAFILDQAGAGLYLAGCKYAVAMDGRMPDGNERFAGAGGYNCGFGGFHSYSGKRFDWR